MHINVIEIEHRPYYMSSMMLRFFFTSDMHYTFFSRDSKIFNALHKHGIIPRCHVNAVQDDIAAKIGPIISTFPDCQIWHE